MTYQDVMKDGSDAQKLLQFVWANCGRAISGHSWLRVNQAMRNALRLAIASGFKFDRDDFCYLASELRLARWMGSDPEWAYSEACEARNISACLSYESWVKRKPFMLEGRRVYVGREFSWKHRRSRCTSITPEFIRVRQEGFLVSHDDFVTVDEIRAENVFSDQAKVRQFKLTRDELVAT